MNLNQQKSVVEYALTVNFKHVHTIYSHFLLQKCNHFYTSKDEMFQFIQTGVNISFSAFFIIGLINSCIRKKDYTTSSNLVKYIILFFLITIIPKTFTYIDF